MESRELIEWVGEAVDLLGVAIMVVGAVAVLAIYGWRLARGAAMAEAYGAIRHGMGRSILLGLELLIVADIIRTVAVDPTFTSVGVLGLIVLIRTFLSITLGLEIEGRWPWQQRPAGEIER